MQNVPKRAASGQASGERRWPMGFPVPGLSQQSVRDGLQWSRTPPPPLRSKADIWLMRSAEKGRLLVLFRPLARISQPLLGHSWALLTCEWPSILRSGDLAVK